MDLNRYYCGKYRIQDSRSILGGTRRRFSIPFIGFGKHPSYYEQIKSILNNPMLSWQDKLKQINEIIDLASRHETPPWLWHSPPSVTIEEGSIVEPALYIIFGVDKDGDCVNEEIYTKNGLTGEIEFSGTKTSTIIQNAINNLPNKGGRIFTNIIDELLLISLK